MQLQHLEYFQTLATLKHFTKAAETLNISQPALSRVISKLEEELGAPLFERHGRKTKLTQFGRAFQVSVNRVLSDLEYAKSQIADMAGMENGLIHMASAFSGILPPIVLDFFSKYNCGESRLLIQPPEDIVGALNDGDLDFALVEKGSCLPPLCFIPLLEEEIFIFVPHDHPLADRETVKLDEFKNDYFIMGDASFDLNKLITQFCHAAGFHPKVLMESSEAELLTKLVAGGYGVCFVTELLLQNIPFYSKYIFKSFSSNTLDPSLPRALRISSPKCKRSIGIATVPDRYMSVAAAKFQQHIIDYFKKYKMGKNTT